MSFWSALRELLSGTRPPPPATMRNKPGGLAWIRIAPDHGDGSYDLHGRMVTTVRLDGDSFWVIDPPQHFMVRDFMLASNGRIAMPGDPAIVESMHDDLLEPIRDVGDGERDESAVWLPPVPTTTKAPRGVPA